MDPDNRALWGYAGYAGTGAILDYCNNKTETHKTETHKARKTGKWVYNEVEPMDGALPQDYIST
jgi:hypothetical protein